MIIKVEGDNMNANCSYRYIIDVDCFIYVASKTSRTMQCKYLLPSNE